MQLVPILLVAVVMAVDEGLRPIGAHWGLSRMAVAMLAIVPLALLYLVAEFAAWRCGRKIDRRAAEAAEAVGGVGGRRPRGAIRTVMRLERLIRIIRALIVINHVAAVAVFDWLGVIRSVVGDLVLVDECIAIAPPLAGYLLIWWAYYPIDRRLRDAVVISRLDEGRPVYDTPSRSAYVLLQARMHLLLLLAPILLIVGCSEIVDAALRRYADSATIEWMRHAGKFGAAAVVFIAAPLIARAVLSVRPLAPGDLREMLLAVGRRHGVKVRQVLLWNTNGSMINAAVMGLFAPLRYVMMTDALLESLREDQVRAVMAHEIGHVRRNHMYWLIGCLIAALMVAFILAVTVIYVPLWLLDAPSWLHEGLLEWIELGSRVAQLVIAFMIFGWVSRRFERQADTFAIQHLSGLGEPAPAMQPLTVKPEAVNAMCGALAAIARLNSVDPHRPSWRHGSIAWRIEYLRSIVERPIKGLPIDRQVVWIKVATSLILCGWLAWEIVNWRTSQPAEDSAASVRVEPVAGWPAPPALQSSR